MDNLKSYFTIIVDVCYTKQINKEDSNIIFLNLIDCVPCSAGVTIEIRKKEKNMEFNVQMMEMNKFGLSSFVY